MGVSCTKVSFKAILTGKKLGLQKNLKANNLVLNLRINFTLVQKVCKLRCVKPIAIYSYQVIGEAA